MLPEAGSLELSSSAVNVIQSYPERKVSYDLNNVIISVSLPNFVKQFSVSKPSNSWLFIILFCSLRGMKQGYSWCPTNYNFLFCHPLLCDRKEEGTKNNSFQKVFIRPYLTNQCCTVECLVNRAESSLLSAQFDLIRLLLHADYWSSQLSYSSYLPCCDVTVALYFWAGFIQ